MAEDKGEDEKQEDEGSEEGEAGEATTPEEQAKARIAELEHEVSGLQNEVKIMEGMKLNRNPEMIAKAKAENEEAKDRMSDIFRATYALISDLALAREPEIEKAGMENLKQGAVFLCNELNLDPDVWKNIAS